MRLLNYYDDGELSLTEFIESEIPKYAILSHRWGTEEVTYKDLQEGLSKDKPSYGKIRFCGDQARRDGLQYFWVDTCCIDKSSSAELQEAINSMFDWYRNATKCYAYLLDVSSDRSNEPWELAFRKSKWFTRGWTLQELIAPVSVDFFSKEGNLLGNKTSLERCVFEVTGISVDALRGSPLSNFSVAERMSWRGSRETRRQEDKAYSLCGIFGVFMTIKYGEGQENALRRLQKKADKQAVEDNVNGSAPFAPHSKFASRGIVRQTKTHRVEKPRRVTGFGSSRNFRGGSEIKCYRCDNDHYLNECYANTNTVSKARDQRMRSGRCLNCGSEKHWEKDCDLEICEKLN